MRRSMIGLTAGCLVACLAVAVPAAFEGVTAPVLGTGLALLCCSLAVIPVLLLRHRVQRRHGGRRARSEVIVPLAEPVQDEPLCG